MGIPTFAGGVDLLSLLSAENRQRVLVGSREEHYPAGAVAFRAGSAARAVLVHKGLGRAYIAMEDGRETTVAFLHPGNLLGARNVVGTAAKQEPPLTHVQAVLDSTFTILDLETVRSLAATNLEVVNALAIHLAERVHYDLRLIAVRSLGTIQERLAFDLLDRACRSQRELGRLEAKATHWDYAYSIGSSREVVSRALKAWRETRIVETAPGLTRVLDPARLVAVAHAFVG